MKTNASSQEFFESKYRGRHDPWNFATSAYEQQRYDAICDALSHRRYELAFEPGCSIGVLTARLAAICGRVRAMDIARTAVQHARKRCKDFPNVEITCGAIPALLPTGAFDLILLSEIGYYLTEDTLQALGIMLTKRLSERGVLLAAHWLGRSADHVLSGDRVHEILGALDGLAHEHSERHAGFRLDRWGRE
jgi:SAM-dependent methyltransferase